MQPDISITASLIGDTARAKMLTALMGGKALTATELACEADITAQTASSHLNKLVQGQLLAVRKQGRHKYFQLKNAQIAELLETLLTITSALEHPKTKTGPVDTRLRTSRICYDHLAGELGVAIYDALKHHGHLVDEGETTTLTDQGKTFFATIGFDFNQPSKRSLCRSCLDWSERTNHLAGILGQWILNDLFNKGWASKNMDSRAISFTPKGLRLLEKQYGFVTTNA